MTRAVLDASALLAVMFREAGAERVVGYLPGATVSSVNLAETLTRSIEAGMALENAQRMVFAFRCEVVPFDAEYAALTASLRASTRPFGISLADRACLALGLNTGRPVVTADRKWKGLAIGVEVIPIR